MEEKNMYEKNKTYSNVDHIPFEHHNVVYTSQIFQEYQGIRRSDICSHKGDCGEVSYPLS